jgi:hypothetical protein
MFAAKKIDYLSSTVRGEFDGLYCITYQGRYGDSAGVLSDVTKVKGPSPINSGLAMEWASKLVDTDGDQVRNVHGHVGWLLADESESYGYVVESWDKTSKFAYLVDTVTAFGGSSQGWDYILAARQTRSDGNLYFDIDGTGRVHATAGSFGAPSYSFKGDEDTGLYHINTNAIAIITGASNGVIFDATGQFYPMSDNTQRNGVASLRWSVVYAGTGTINTSDADTKQQIGDIDPAVLRAWGKVKYSQYKFNDAVAKKADGARWHIGLIAQQVKDAFESEGLDAFAYGLLCYDEWPDQYEEGGDEYVEVPIAEPTPQSGGAFDRSKTRDFGPTKRVPVKKGERRLLRPAGKAYGIRYDEALALECAYLRSKIGG